MEQGAQYTARNINTRLAASANASLADEDKAPDVAMPGGRPKSDVWKLFDDTADGSAICQRCRDVMRRRRESERRWSVWRTRFGETLEQRNPSYTCRSGTRLRWTAKSSFTRTHAMRTVRLLLA
ncbi:hypothetical protein PC111_g11120 [Phytophthora cactorum]|nr:hypothetical protein PC111_g11120 [Phytophthora cactorum]KAG4052751.1 hypothetical protein PC123_g12099 [Phytophthora cactorum]